MFSIQRSLRAGLLLGAFVLALLTSVLGLAGCEKQARSGQQGAATNTAVATAPAAPASQPQDYQRAVYDPIHFKPAIEHATDAQCLVCHKEVLQPSVRQHSIAGNAASEALAWYQQTSTYTGPQETFHRRHLVTPLATTLMQMRCTTCHEGNEPRDEAPGTSASSQNGALVLRKMVNPETICLRCHGKMNWPVMGLPASWEKSKVTFQNNCLLCHAAVRTNRHQVNYLNAQAIEQAGAKSGDACFGCHGGRAWYRLNYPYPRHAWSAMPPEVPQWAKTRSTESEARFLTGLNAQKESTQ
jgi:hypothetical protein